LNQKKIFKRIQTVLNHLNVRLANDNTHNDEEFNMKVQAEQKSAIEQKKHEEVSNQISHRAALRLQNQFRLERHHLTIKTFLGIDIKECSKRNFNLLRHKLKSGCPTLLSKEEAQLFEVIASLLTLKHATSYLEDIKKSGEMDSLKQRERLKKPITNRHTYKQFGVDDDVYFVLGIGNHRTPSFLTDASDEISIPLQQMADQDKETLKRLWIGGHLSDYINEIPSNPYLLGNATYQFSHHWENRTKIYRIKTNTPVKQGSQNIREWTLKMEDEVYEGEHVIPAVAYQFILMLRLLGGNQNPFVQKLYTTILDPKIVSTEKEAMLSKTMTILFPGWVYPEAKIATKLNIQKPYVRFSNRYEEKEDSECRHLGYENIKIFHKAIEKGEITKIKYYLSQRYSPNTRYSRPEETPLMLAIKSRNFDIARLLIEAGADINLKCESVLNSRNALHYAVLYGTPEFLNDMLNTQRVDEDEPLIKKLPNIFVKDERFMDLLGLAASLGTSRELQRGENENPLQLDENAEKLKILLKHFPTPLSHMSDAHVYLSIAVENDNLAAMKVIGDSGIDLNPKICWGKTALMISAEKGNVKALQYLLKIGENPNTRYQSRQYSSLLGKAFYDSNDNGKTALDFAKEKGHKDVIKLLEEAGSESQQNAAKKIKLEQKNFLDNESVVCVVIGEDKVNTPYVLLGRKRGEDGLPTGEFLYPGGKIDREDNSVISAAQRELKEETGLNLEEAIQKKEVLVSSLFNVPIERDRSHDTITHFILFDIRGYSRKNKMVILPGDDLIELRKISLKDEFQVIDDPIKGERYKTKTYGHFIQMSNGLLLKYLKESFILTSIQCKSLVEFCEIEENGYRLLGEAASENNLNRMKDLLKKGAKFTNRSYEMICPINAMVVHRNFDGIKLLLDNGADIENEANGTTPLRTAILKKDLEMVLFLLERGARSQVNRDEYSRSVLDTAGKAGSIEILDALVKYGADVHFANRYGIEEHKAGGYIRHSVLICAIQEGHLPMVRHLVKHYGCHINLETHYNNKDNALMTAIRFRQPEIAWFLLTQLVNLTYKNKDGETVQSLLQNNAYQFPGKDKIKTIVTFLEKYPTIYHLFSNRCGIFPEALEVKKDEKEGLSLHVTFENEADAKKCIEKTAATQRTTADGKPYVRIAYHRFQKLIGLHLSKEEEKTFAQYFHDYLVNNKEALELSDKAYPTIWNLISHNVESMQIIPKGRYIPNENELGSMPYCKVPLLTLRAISECRSLKKLSLSCHHVHPTLFKLYTQMIQISYTLKEIEIKDSTLGDAELECVTEAILQSKSIQKVCIGKNQFTDRGLLKFLEALHKVKELQQITLDATHLKNFEEILGTYLSKSGFHHPIHLTYDTERQSENMKKLSEIQVKNRTEWVFQNMYPSVKDTLSKIQDKKQISSLEFGLLNSEQSTLVMNELIKNASLPNGPIHLSFTYCTFSQTAWLMLCQFLQKNKTIRRVALRFTGVEDAHGKRVLDLNSILESLLTRATPLDSLTVSDLFCKDQYILTFCKLLACDKTQLKQVDFHIDPDLSSANFLALFGEALLKNKYLKILIWHNISYFQMSTSYKVSERVAFYQAILRNRSLIHIDLGKWDNVYSKELSELTCKNSECGLPSTPEVCLWLSQKPKDNGNLKDNGESVKDNGKSVKSFLL